MKGLTLKNKLQILKKYANNIILPLLDISYENFSIKREEAGTSYWYTLYSNSFKLNRRVEVSYFSDIDIDLKIIRIPYKGISDYFSLNIYLQNHSVKKELYDFMHIHGEFEDAVKQIFENYCNMLNEVAKGILDGEEWSEGYHPKW